VSFRIDKELKEKMDKFKYINWSEVVRRAIYETIKKEEEKMKEKDRSKISYAVLKISALRRRAEGWNSVEEIRKWRERL
jgi:Arc/MetJ-type ribon-helix-helix transcriptional regulator